MEISSGTVFESPFKTLKFLMLWMYHDMVVAKCHIENRKNNQLYLTFRPTYINFCSEIYIVLCACLGVEGLKQDKHF